MTFIPGIGETGPITGPLVLGYILSAILFGILTIQVHSYYDTFPNDKWWIRWLVGTLFVLEIIVTICTLVDSWAAFGTGWGNINSLLFYDWSLLVIAMLTGFIASVVQCFFAYRIFKLTHSIWLSIIIYAISSLQCVMVFYGAITNGVRGRSFEAYYQLSTFASISLVADAVCDIIIATSTVIILVKTIRLSHFRKTKTTIKRLIRLSVETGLITASFAIVELVLWQAEKYLNYHYILGLVLGRLYSNAMMAALNSRTSPVNHGNITTMTMHNQLTLFQDEYPESSPAATMPLTSIKFIRKVDVAQDSGGGIDVITSPKDEYGQVHKTKSRTSDTSV